MKSGFKIIQSLVFHSICLFSLECLAQQNFDTLVDYNNTAEFPYSIYQESDSGYNFITSGNNEIEFNKLNKDGSLSFQKNFGIPGTNLFVGLSNSLKQTFDGRYAFGGGVQYSNTSINKADGILVKYNAYGDTEFVKVFGDTTWETIYDCFQTSDSGFVLVGIKCIYSPYSDCNFWIVKTDPNGILVWERTLGTHDDERAYCVIENNSHQIVVSGWQGIIGAYFYPYWAVYNLQGTLIQTKSLIYSPFVYGGGLVYNYNNINEYILVGVLDSVVNINDDKNPGFILRMDSNFIFKWMTIFNSPEPKYIYIAKKVSDFGIVLVGYKHDNNTNEPVGWIAKIDSSGNKLWEHFYAHANHTNTYNYFSDFRETFDHGFVVCGTSWSGSSQDSWIVKLDSNGCLDTSCGLNTASVELFYSQNSLEIFPNPSTTQVTIKYNLMLGKEGKLSVFNILGEKMKEQLLVEGNKQIEINIDQWAKGIYLGIVQSGNMIYKSEFIKE